ncbi:MAG: hypothetical protein AB7Q81_25090 [Gammaproteobacteria bacterium]
MPITPLHLGPGLVLKGLVDARLSLVVFAFAQLVLDVEVILRLLLGAEPLHGWTNTLAGASLALVPTVLLGKPLGELVLRRWNAGLPPTLRCRLGTPTTIGWRAAAWGGALGVYSHWLLDAFMHVDALALWPLLPGNPLAAWFSIDAVNGACALTFVVGAALFAGRRRRRASRAL